ncbi:DUF6922 domain-containing protein [Aquimarina aquimarini]|uniref:DUF6922 domain-containing protein n=1 Tax=Aquimarina aquimarini TaxID=1191734 RepID=UPI000D54C11B|nr:hypothetical protein [Aquimarina aquimarini]
MAKTKSISSFFPKHLFWDMDMDRLDFQQDKDIIIPRALFATTEQTFLKDITLLEKIYKKDQILFYLKNTKERISNLVCDLVSKRYNTEPFKRFRL